MKYQFAVAGETFIANVIDASGAVVGQCIADCLPHGTPVASHPDSPEQADTIIGVVPEAQPDAEATAPGARRWPFSTGDSE